MDKYHKRMWQRAQQLANTNGVRIETIAKYIHGIAAKGRVRSSRGGAYSTSVVFDADHELVSATCNCAAFRGGAYRHKGKFIICKHGEALALAVYMKEVANA
jgi:hypothetical protein